MTIATAIRTTLRRAFTENLALKGFSLVLALTLFAVIHGSEDAQRSMFVDVVALLPPLGARKVLRDPLPDQVRITLRGSQSVINGLRRDDVPAVELDLRAAPRSVFFDASRAFTVPAGVQVTGVEPSTLTLRWENRTGRTVGIRPRLVGTPTSGHELSRQVTVEPSTVRIEGPASVVDATSAVDTDEVDVSGLAQGRHERRVHLSRAMELTYARDEPVRVLFDVVAERREVVARDVAVTAVGVGVRTELRPLRVDVHLAGTPAGAAAFAESRIVASVDLAGLPGESQGTVPLAVQVSGLPDGLEVTRVSPPEVLVTFQRSVQGARD